ncbi:MAG: redoxin domain-containing protein [Rhodospirillales bacterium]|nr:redoxin domain-containing protein [Rhodospirillales bacterium]
MDTAKTVLAEGLNFTLEDQDGKKHSLADFADKVVVLEWTNDGCPFVQKHYTSANMQTLQREATRAGVVWLSVISSAPGEQGHVTPDKANALTRSRDAAPSGILVDPDGKIGRAYGAQVTPHMYIIGADGTLLYQGGIDSIASTNVADIQKAQPYFRNALQAVLKGEKVQNAVTRPYGCTIKYAS